MPSTETTASLQEQADLLERQIGNLEDLAEDAPNSKALQNAIARAKEAQMWLQEAADESDD